MKYDSSNEKKPSNESTEIGYSLDDFRKMILGAKSSGYSKVTAKEIKADAHKQHGLISK